MKVIEYLKRYGIEKLKRDFAIYAGFYETLMVLNSTAHSPKDSAITSECVGLFLDHQFNVVSRSFDKIPSYYRDENYSSIIDDSYTFYKRFEDVCLIRIYFWNGKWNVGTRDFPFADQIISGYINKSTYEDVFLLALGHLTPKEFQRFCNRHMDTKNTYLFSITFEPVDKERVKFSDIWYLATRENSTGQYLIDNELPIQSPQAFSFPSFRECEEAARYQKIKNGFIVYKSGIPFVKIRNPDIVAKYYKKMDRLTQNNVVKLYVKDQVEGYIRYFPENKPDVERLVAKIKQRLEECRNKYDEWKWDNGKVDLGEMKSYGYIALGAYRNNQDFIATFHMCLWHSDKVRLLNNLCKKRRQKKMIPPEKETRYDEEVVNENPPEKQFKIFDKPLPEEPVDSPISQNYTFDEESSSIVSKQH